MEATMKLPRRQFLHLAAGAVALPALSARAQTYPTKPVHLVVGLAAGGGQDIVARLMGRWLSDRTGSADSSSSRIDLERPAI
jgi:tripartite-type tricarboxylate transporter receptor subunit TctC